MIQVALADQNISLRCAHSSGNVRGNVVLALHALAVNRQSQIFGHNAVDVDRLNAGLFQIRCELSQRLVLVDLGAVNQATSPSVNGRNTVGRGLVAFLVFAVMSAPTYQTLYGHAAVVQLTL